jgi:hypothetical protein
MKELVTFRHSDTPALVAAAGDRARMRFVKFFAANIRNPHTRRAYYLAAEEFLTWCTSAGVPSIAAVQPVHVATWIEASTRELAAPSVKQRLAALRHLFDWLVNGQVVPCDLVETSRFSRRDVESDRLGRGSDGIGRPSNLNHHMCEAAHTSSEIGELFVVPLPAARPRPGTSRHGWRAPFRKPIYGTRACRGSRSTSARAPRASGLSGLTSCSYRAPP